MRPLCIVSKRLFKMTLSLVSFGVLARYPCGTYSSRQEHPRRSVVNSTSDGMDQVALEELWRKLPKKTVMAKPAMKNSYPIALRACEQPADENKCCGSKSIPEFLQDQDLGDQSLLKVGKYYGAGNFSRSRWRSLDRFVSSFPIPFIDTTF